MQFQIGEFSRISRISVKTLRYYHDEGILVPASTDYKSGYRFYNAGSIERARIVRELRNLSFSIKEIKDILANCENDSDIVSDLREKQTEIRKKVRSLDEIDKSLSVIIANEQEMEMKQIQTEVCIKELPDQIIAGIRFKGCYGDVGKYFGELYKKAGAQAGGQPFCLYYDAEYKEGDADIEACIPLKKELQKEGLTVRRLPAVKAASIFHKGAYDTLGDSYRKIFGFMRELKGEAVTPSREVYLKGPGMIFRGNPAKYITEIQIPLSE